jgi:single-stranded-DNA-specific exonuclease
VVQVLANRGIEPEAQERYLEAGREDVSGWRVFGEELMCGAVEVLRDTVENGKTMFTVVDCDCDGFSAASILINFLNACYPDYVASGKLVWSLHDGKQHGLPDMMEKVPEGCSLVVMTDASSSDYVQHRQLKDAGCQVLVLDHHDANEGLSRFAYTVNNQFCDGVCKAGTGAYVTWQFCRAYEETVFDSSTVSDQFLDLCALGCCGDMASYREMEIKAVFIGGFTSVTNPLLMAMTENRRYIMEKRGGSKAYMAVAFYIVPYLNAICRSGTMDEKETVFSGLLEHLCYTLTDSSLPQEGQCSVIEEALRVMDRVKARQTEVQESAMFMLEELIQEQVGPEDKAIVLECPKDSIDPGVVGLCANAVQSQYGKPTVLLVEKENGRFKGSARNVANGPVDDFKELCLSTNTIGCGGHASAFGVWCDKRDDIGALRDALNEALKDEDLDKQYLVDFCWGSRPDPDAVLEIADAAELWGQQVPEPLVAVKCQVEPAQVAVLGQNKDTLKTTLNGVDVMLFRRTPDEVSRFMKPDQVMTAVASCKKNVYNGKVKPQLVVEDYELEQDWIF